MGALELDTQHPMTLTLNIVGGGKLGRTLGKLWARAGTFAIGQVCCSQLVSAHQAVEFIGAGQPISDVNALQAADIWLIATPDQSIAALAVELAAKAPIAAGNIALHCSGALPATHLAPLQQHGLAVASVHPVHSFADPARSLETFRGSVCSYEGDPQALTQLLPAFEAVGAELLAIDSAAKSLYHAGTVMACNYLVPLLDASLACLQAAGLERACAAKLLGPLVAATADNLLSHNAEAALTGPISRGDVEIVAGQLDALNEQLPALLPSYRALGLQTLAIARDQGKAKAADLNALEQLLANASGDSNTPIKTDQ